MALNYTSWLIEINNIPSSALVEIGWYKSKTEILSGGIFVKFKDKNYSQHTIILSYNPSFNINENIGVIVQRYRENEFKLEDVFAIYQKDKACGFLQGICSSHEENNPELNCFDFVKSFFEKSKNVGYFIRRRCRKKIEQFANLRRNNFEKVVEILDMINGTTTISIGWYQKKKILKHAGFVLIFDDEKKYTLDYGKANNASKAPKGDSSGSVGGVSINPYDADYSFYGTLCKISSTHFINFLIFCFNNIKDYRLIGNNCRDFLRVGVTYLVKENILVTSNFQAFQEQIKNIKDRDAAPIIAVTIIPVALVALFFFIGWEVALAGLALALVIYCGVWIYKKVKFDRNVSTNSSYQRFENI